MRKQATNQQDKPKFLFFFKPRHSGSGKKIDISKWESVDEKVKIKIAKAGTAKKHKQPA